MAGSNYGAYRSAHLINPHGLPFRRPASVNCAMVQCPQTLNTIVQISLRYVNRNTLNFEKQ